MELPEALKKYNFAPLPPRIYRQDEEQENQKKETGRYDVLAGEARGKNLRKEPAPDGEPYP